MNVWYVNMRRYVNSMAVKPRYLLDVYKRQVIYMLTAYKGVKRP